MSAADLLALAISIEVVGTCSLRQSDGFTRPGWVALMLACYAVSLYLLARIIRHISIGIAYAIWAGAGTALIAVVSVFLFDERLNSVAVAGIGLVIIGIVVINLAGTAH